MSAPNAAPKPSRKSIGTPISSATSAPRNPSERAREKNSSWSAGTQPRASPLRNTGIRSSSTSARNASSPCAQYRSVPAMITGRRASRSSAIAVSIAAPSGSTPDSSPSPATPRTLGIGTKLPSSGALEKTTSSGKSRNAGPP